ncbi:hypothetical protein E1176_01765, partial [Fulvivirga sp. RKSG066]|uniref:FISUMP domain-containing protein n=1 Tax=Fulvivirga aurantia TaxID=2529383 RepID=UPI0024835EBC
DLCADVTISFDINQTGCNEVTVENTTGGEGAYKYSIDGINFQSNAEFSGVASGANTITVRDVNGCEAEKSIAIEDVNITFDLVQTGCDKVTVKNIQGTGGGDVAYSIDGENFDTLPTFEGLTGTESITVRNADGCTATKAVELAEELTLEASADAFTITAAAAGGVGPFQYSIDKGANFQTEATFEVGEAKDYTVVVKDENGCEATASVTAEEVTTTTDSRDGQTYRVVKIGTQIWFAENFNLDTNTSDSTSSYYYDNDQASYEEQYGRLYTWYVAKEIAPEGWELPSISDFETLVNTVGGSDTEAATKLNVGGSSGFHSEFGGVSDGTSFYDLGNFATYWSSDSDATDTGRGQYFATFSAPDIQFSDIKKSAGASVRLLKIQ